MRVLLLGATGTAGRATLTALADAGHDIVALHRGDEPPIQESERISFRKADVSAPLSLKHDGIRGERFDAFVTTLASRTGVPEEAWAIDHRANAEALRQACEAGVTRVVALSAICVQKPMLAFQFAKLAFEDELMKSGADYSIVRPTAFFKSLSGQIERVKNGKPFMLFGNGELTRCKPISDRDLGRFMALCLTDADKRNRVLPIGGPGPAISLKDQGEELFRLTGQQPRFRHLPVGMFDAIGTVLRLGGHVSKGLKTKAELARIGKYYATESMLVWDAGKRRYDADATPEFGEDSLFQHYAEVLSKGQSVDLGAHRVFGS
jgi:divinyl chlorophyllide a 8-vinyl-reductase